MHAMDGVIVSEELAYGCSGMMTAMEANSLASAPVILAGTHEQKVRHNVSLHCHQSGLVCSAL